MVWHWPGGGAAIATALRRWLMICSDFAPTERSTSLAGFWVASGRVARLTGSGRSAPEFRLPRGADIERFAPRPAESQFPGFLLGGPPGGHLFLDRPSPRHSAWGFSLPSDHRTRGVAAVGEADQHAVDVGRGRRACSGAGSPRGAFRCPRRPRLRSVPRSSVCGFPARPAARRRRRCSRRAARRAARQTSRAGWPPGRRGPAK